MLCKITSIDKVIEMILEQDFLASLSSRQNLID